MSILVISFVFLGTFVYIPMSTIAALLVMVSIKMVATEHIVHMYATRVLHPKRCCAYFVSTRWKHDRIHFCLLLLSALVCVLEDTMMGILVGGAIALLIFAADMSAGHAELVLYKEGKRLRDIDARKLDANDLELELESDSLELGAHVLILTIPLSYRLWALACHLRFVTGDTIVYRFAAQLTYVNAATHQTRIAKLLDQRSMSTIVFDWKYVWCLDLDGVDALCEILKLLEAAKIRVLFCGVAHVGQVFAHHSFFGHKKEAGAVFLSAEEAVACHAEQRRHHEAQQLATSDSLAVVELTAAYTAV